MLITNWLLGTMVGNDCLFGKIMIIDWLLGKVLINDCPVVIVMVSGWLLRIMVISNCSLATMVSIYFLFVCFGTEDDCSLGEIVIIGCSLEKIVVIGFGKNSDHQFIVVNIYCY